jgi:hypothetical protein
VKYKFAAGNFGYGTAIVKHCPDSSLFVFINTSCLKGQPFTAGVADNGFADELADAAPCAKPQITGAVGC